MSDDLTPGQRLLLLRLVKAKGGFIPGNTRIAVMVQGLRQKLSPDAIVNNRGTGYRLSDDGLTKAAALLETESA